LYIAAHAFYSYITDGYYVNDTYYNLYLFDITLGYDIIWTVEDNVSSEAEMNAIKNVASVICHDNGLSR